MSKNNTVVLDLRRVRTAEAVILSSMGASALCAVTSNGVPCDEIVLGHFLAQSKGRSGLVWWLVSLFLGSLATLLIVVLPKVNSAY